MISSNSSSLTSRTYSRWTNLRFRSSLLMYCLCTAQTSQHKLEMVVRQTRQVVSKHSLGLLEEVEEVQEGAEEVATKLATGVEAEVLKALIEVEVVATKTRIAIPSIREALKYNNNQTYLASWQICRPKTQQTKCQLQSPSIQTTKNLQPKSPKKRIKA